MLNRIVLIGLGLWIAGILPIGLPAEWVDGFADFMGRDWRDLVDQYGLAGQWARARPWIGGVIAGAAVIGLARHMKWGELRLRRLFGRRTYGNARFANRFDLLRAGLNKPGGLILGSLQGMDFFHNGEGHLLTIGGVGGGKSSGLVVPALLTLTEGSIIVTDPSGELAAMTSRRRAEIGPVVFLNPFGAAFEREAGLSFEDSGFNPLSTLDPKDENFYTAVNSFARLLMVNDRRESGSYWNDEGAEFLALMIANIKLYEKAEHHTLEFLYSAVRDSTKGMTQRLEWIIARKNPTLMDEAQRFLDIITNAKPQWSGISSKAALATKRYAPGTPLGIHTAKNGFDAARLKREKVTLYLLVPSAQLATALPWLNLLMGVFGHAIGQPGKAAPVTMLMDETPALGYLPDLRNFMAQFRKAGLRVWLFTQTYAAMAGPELYGDAGMKEIMGLSKIKQFFAVNEPEVQRLVSELCGQRSVSNPSSTGASGDVGQPLIRPDQVRGLRKWSQIVIFDGQAYPIKGKLIPYFTRKNWRAMVDPNPYRGEGK